MRNYCLARKKKKKQVAFLGFYKVVGNGRSLGKKNYFSIYEITVYSTEQWEIKDIQDKTEKIFQHIREEFFRALSSAKWGISRLEFNLGQNYYHYFF